jgi:hypothetical protein
VGCVLDSLWESAEPIVAMSGWDEEVEDEEEEGGVEEVDDVVGYLEEVHGEWSELRERAEEAAFFAVVEALVGWMDRLCCEGGGG